MITAVTIPAKGKVVVSGMPSKQALRDLMTPTRIRIYRAEDPFLNPALEDPSATHGIGRAHAWTIVHMLAAQGEVTVRWEVFEGTGTCNRRCWNARNFGCSCSCGGRKHVSHIDWKELGHNWLEATMSAPALLEAS